MRADSVNETRYSEEYSCLGIKADYHEQCDDCGTSTYCFGLKYGKKCATEKLEDNMEWKTISNSCN